MNYEDIYKDAVEKYDYANERSFEARNKSFEDRRFLSSPEAQWENVKTDLLRDNPKYTVSKMEEQFLRQCGISDPAGIAIRFRAHSMDVEGLDVANILTDILRTDEQRSDAHIAYQNANFEMISGGIGGWRYRVGDMNSSDPDNIDQCIYIDPIYDYDRNVVWDYSSKHPSKKDAKFCFINSLVSEDEFEKRWGDFRSEYGFQGNKSINLGESGKGRLVNVSEYYTVEVKKEPLLYFKHADGDTKKIFKKEIEEDEDLADTLKFGGYSLLRDRIIEKSRVYKYILGGSDILEGPILIPGERIPVVCVMSKRFFIDNTENFSGFIRPLRDLVILNNFLFSKLISNISQSQPKIPIVTPTQVEGHEWTWANAVKENLAYTLLNETSFQGPLGNIGGPVESVDVLSALGTVDGSLNELVGFPRQMEAMRSNVSGRALDSFQGWHDAAGNIYAKALSDGVGSGGKIWLGMARHIYAKKSMLKVMNSQGEYRVVNLKGSTSNNLVMSNISDTDFDVAVDRKSLSTTRRREAHETFIKMLPLAQTPDDHAILFSMAMKNTEVEGGVDVAMYYENKLKDIGVIPDEERRLARETEEKENPSRDDMLKDAIIESAQADAVKSALLGAKAKSDTELSDARALKTRAEALKLLKENSISQNEAILNEGN